MPPKAVRNAIRWMFARPERLPDTWYDAATDEFLRFFRSPRGRIAFFSCLRQIYLEDAFGSGGFWTRLPELAPPALFLWGSHDPLVPPAFAHHVGEWLPSAEQVTLDRCGHLPQVECAEKTNALLDEFFERARLPVASPVEAERGSQAA